MCATRAVLVLLFAVIACAVAIPAALPQPESPIGPVGAPNVGIEQRSLDKRQIEALEAGAEPASDLKASSSYGYGWYGGYGGYGYPGFYRPYYGGWGGYPYYGYGYGYGYGYPYYRPYGGYYGIY